jgi:hypothetical protein
MHRDWKRAKQWAFLGVLVVAAWAEVVADVGGHVKRLEEECLATPRVTLESVSAHSAGAEDDR